MKPSHNFCSQATFNAWKDLLSAIQYIDPVGEAGSLCPERATPEQGEYVTFICFDCAKAKCNSTCDGKRALFRIQ